MQDLAAGLDGVTQTSGSCWLFGTKKFRGRGRLLDTIGPVSSFHVERECKWNFSQRIGWDYHQKLENHWVPIAHVI